jgi:CRP/FNR family transcriptional regulator
MKGSPVNKKFDHEIRVATLKTLELFQDLSHDLLLELSKLTTIRTLKKNEVIFEQGDMAKKFTFVNKGMVKVIRSLKPGQEMILRIATEGEFFGILAIFSEQTYAVRAVTEGEVTLVEIPKEPFFDFLDKHPEIYRKFLKLSSQNSQQMMRKVPEMALTRIESRVAKILLNLTKKIGYQEDGLYQLNMPLTRKEIAAMAGTTTETVVRVLGRLEKTSVIEMNKHHIMLRDQDYLESLVDETDHL